MSSQNTNLGTAPQSEQPLLAVGRRHWRAFAPEWLMPVVLLAVVTPIKDPGRAQSIFVVFAPFFFWAFFRSTGPWRRRQITYWQSVFWTMLIPMVIWIVAVLIRGMLLGAFA